MNRVEARKKKSSVESTVTAGAESRRGIEFDGDVYTWVIRVKDRRFVDPDEAFVDIDCFERPRRCGIIPLNDIEFRDLKWFDFDEIEAVWYLNPGEEYIIVTWNYDPELRQPPNLVTIKLVKDGETLASVEFVFKKLSELGNHPAVPLLRQIKAMYDMDKVLKDNLNYVTAYDFTPERDLKPHWGGGAYANLPGDIMEIFKTPRG